ncbi:hypothetical protein [Anaerofustis sp.]|uniref:hypothetical protein n=1 Tax=Anaerofustis sp. TaxID=1872517 RepID=UPI0025C1821D|nr:hypothetical protein [Anaerofustis sp.]
MVKKSKYEELFKIANNANKVTYVSGGRAVGKGASKNVSSSLNTYKRKGQESSKGRYKKSGGSFAAKSVSTPVSSYAQNKIYAAKAPERRYVNEGIKSMGGIGGELRKSSSFIKHQNNMPLNKFEKGLYGAENMVKSAFDVFDRVGDIPYTNDAFNKRKRGGAGYVQGGFENNKKGVNYQKDNPFYQKSSDMSVGTRPYTYPAKEASTDVYKKRFTDNKGYQDIKSAQKMQTIKETENRHKKYAPVMNTRRNYNDHDSSINIDVYNGKFGPGSFSYEQEKADRIEHRNKMHGITEKIRENARPMNSNKTYKESENNYKMPGRLSPENSTGVYYEKVGKEKEIARQIKNHERMIQREAYNARYRDLIDNASSAPRYQDFSRRNYYGDDGGAIKDFVPNDARGRLLERFNEDYADPVAVEYMLEKKGAQNLRFDNADALYKNEVFRFFPKELLDRMNEDERKKAYAMCSEYMGNNEDARNANWKIASALSIEVANREEKEVLQKIKKGDSNYLYQLVCRDTLDRYLEGGKQTFNVMGKSYNPSFKKGRSAAIEYLKKYGTKEEIDIINNAQVLTNTGIDMLFSTSTAKIPGTDLALSYIFSWGKEYNDAMNYGGVNNIKQAQDIAFFEANKGLVLGMAPKIGKNLAKYNSPEAVGQLLNVIEEPDIKNTLSDLGIDFSQSYFTNMIMNKVEKKEYD